uniref:Uncharacterized protein n=1 Tax=Lactuca sativa TaxID=4236 RepID=A0A9R1UEU4_LACSA|nr:hypothetical protein LSAT_V11C900460820 [Lactuca sativa]
MIHRIRTYRAYRNEPTPLVPDTSKLANHVPDPCSRTGSYRVPCVEVKGAQRLEATIGEIKEEVAEVIVHVHGKNKRRKLATLKPRTGPQQLLDWMLEEDFTITYTLTNGIRCFVITCFRHITDDVYVHDDDDDEDEDEEEEAGPSATETLTES